MTPRITPVTHGKKIEHAPVGDIVLIETQHSPGLALSWHAHEHACVTFVTSGSYLEEYGTERHECGRGTVLIKGPGVRHRNRYGDHGARSVIYEIPNLNTEHLLLPPVPCCTRSSVAEALGQRMYHEFSMCDELSPVIIEGLLRAVLALCERERRVGPGKPPIWLDRLRDRLHDDFLGTPTIRELAQAAGVHPDHLSRVFQHHYGLTVGGYLRRLRLQWAAGEIRESDAPLSQIALEAGFSDQSHFTRSFKREIGVTPGRYRSATRWE